MHFVVDQLPSVEVVKSCAHFKFSKLAHSQEIASELHLVNHKSLEICEKSDTVDREKL
jgi:hypothetical protein